MTAAGIERVLTEIEARAGDHEINTGVVKSAKKPCSEFELLPL